MGVNSIDAAAVRAEMEKILETEPFEKSQALARLMRFLVEHLIAGGAPLDENTIAAEVFGRSGGYVAQLDPIVRVQYRRLRDALTEHYKLEWPPGAVILGTAEDGFGVALLERGAVEAARRKGRPAKIMAAIALVALVAGGLEWRHIRPHLATARQAAELDRQARNLLEQQTPSTAVTSARLFEQSLALNSGNARAWSGLADALIAPGAATSTDMSRNEALEKARTAAARAIKLDPRNSEAHAAMAYVKLFQDFDWAGADAEYRRSIELDPSKAQVHRMYAQGLLSRGKFDEAIAQSKLAASLDPAGSPPSVDLPEILSSARRDEEAVAEARRVVQASPDSPGAHLALGIALSTAGHYDEAIPELQASVLVGESLYALTRLGYAYGASGDKVAAQGVLSRLEGVFAQTASVHWSYVALVLAGMGDSQHAMDCLDKAVLNHEGDIAFLGVDPAWDHLRSDPRFVALRKKFALP